MMEETKMAIANYETVIRVETLKTQLVKETNKLNVMLKFEKNKDKVMEQLKITDEICDLIQKESTIAIQRLIDGIKESELL